MAKQTFTTGQVLTAAQMTSLQQTAMGGGSATAKTVSYTLVAADAGTTVIMNSASATTITVNTALFAAGDTVFIVNQGAGVCTITAGTATVSTAGSLAMGQNETGELYFLSASAAIFSEYTQSAAASGLTYVGQATFAAAASAALDNVFTSTYRNYLLFFDCTSAGGADLKITFRTGGVDNTTASYYSQGLSNYSTTVVGANSASQTSAKVGGVGSPGGVIAATIFAPQATAGTRIESRGHKDTGSSAEIGIYYAGFAADTSFDGIKITGVTNNLTGTYRIYGLANS
jgi:hypothetical protein